MAENGWLKEDCTGDVSTNNFSHYWSSSCMFATLIANIYDLYSATWDNLP